MGVGIVVFMAAALQISVASGIEITDRVEYYTIEGSSPRELMAQMQQLGPLNDLGQRSNGLTQWEMEWNHASEMRDGACQLMSLDVSITVVTTLPQWQPPRRVRPALVEQWQQFLASLQQHEATHRQHGLQAAAAVRQAVQAIAPQMDCHALERAITRAGHRELRRYLVETRKYDTLTNFGVKEGVRLHEEREISCCSPPALSLPSAGQ